MFGFDNTIPVDRLKGKYVWSVCFSPRGVSFILDDDDEIRVYSRDDLRARNLAVDVTDLALIAFAGDEITQVTILSGSTLCVEFRSGQEINLIDKINDFENFSLKIDGVEFVI